VNCFLLLPLLKNTQLYGACQMNSTTFWVLLPLGPADRLCILFQHALLHCLPDSIPKQMYPSSSHTHPEYITNLISVHQSFPCTSKALSTFMFVKILFMLLGLASLISSKIHCSPICAPLAIYSLIYFLLITCMFPPLYFKTFEELVLEPSSVKHCFTWRI